MSNFYYSASENLILWESLKEEYINASAWPDDVVLLTDEIAAEFTGDVPEGKVRVAGDDGFPAWADVPPPTQEEITDANAAKKSALRVTANREIEWRQDAVDAGIATDDETAALAEWKKYRVLLMRVDTTDPDWPTPPATQAS
ncbi:TPA: tail fiber assembly protein [Escherichia coli]|nr:tail fiber assembly protein [Escherichia coli]EHY4548015.1 tail fiber assembly protein [Escherichia coli]HCO6314616.1 tail fiber assembly protein [Escherichia coli]HCO6368808.1 tail fiber assembly protein [Escherichia coli]